jgi:hypothetical protein
MPFQLSCTVKVGKVIPYAKISILQLWVEKYKMDFAGMLFMAKFPRLFSIPFK